jgi:polar amino acid transport system substrate-binding protein
MRRLAVATSLAAVVAAALSAWSVAAPSGPAARPAPSAVAKTKLPPLPAAVKNRKRWVIGVKCDFPPFGYIDVQGRNAGYDVEVAQRFAEIAFGKRNRVAYFCVTTPSRIPALQSSRVDIIISTLTWTKARADVIDYSIPYYGATGRLLVRKDGNVNSLNDLNGKTVVTTRGAIYATWMKACLKGVTVLEVDSTATAVLAVKDGRASAFMFDDAFVLGVSTTDRELKLTNDKFLDVPWGIGIRKGDNAMARWVNAALTLMKQRDEFYKILQHNAPKASVAAFANQVPRPNNTLRYPVDKDPATDCTIH